MNWKDLTLKVTFGIVGAIVLILIYDAVAIMNGGTEASISSLIIIASHNYPLIPYLVGWFTGLLFGHLFWRMAPNKDTLASIDKKM